MSYRQFKLCCCAFLLRHAASTEIAFFLPWQEEEDLMQAKSIASYRSFGRVITESIGSRITRVLQSLSGRHSSRSTQPNSLMRNSRRDDDGVDTDLLTMQVLAQFGEEVVKKELPVDQKKKRRDAEILKVRNCESL